MRHFIKVKLWRERTKIKVYLLSTEISPWLINVCHYFPKSDM